MVVHDFAEQGYVLVGGRIDYVGSSRVPVLVYRHGQHVIDLFVLPSNDADDGIAPSQQNGYRIEPLQLGGQPAVLVSDMDSAESSRFIELLGRSAAP